MYGRSDPERYDTHEEKAADDRDFAASQAAWEAEHANTKYVELPEWKEQPYPPLRAGTKGTNTAEHPGRKVHREVFDKAVVTGPTGEPQKRTYVTRYDEGGNVISQGY